MELKIPEYYKDQEGNRLASQELELYCRNIYSDAIEYSLTKKIVYANNAKLNLLSFVQKYDSISKEGDSELFFLYKGLRLVSSFILISDTLSSYEYKIFLDYFNNWFLPIADNCASHWINNRAVWGYVGRCFMRFLNTENYWPSYFYDEIMNFYKNSFRNWPIISQKGLIWTECLRNNSGLWYHYFSLSGWLHLGLIVKRYYNNSTLLNSLQNNFIEYYKYVSNPSRWPYSSDKILGKIEKLFFESADTLELPDNNSWPMNLFLIANNVYSGLFNSYITSWDESQLGQNFWVYPELYLKNNMIENLWIV